MPQEELPERVGVQPGLVADRDAVVDEGQRLHRTDACHGALHQREVDDGERPGEQGGQNEGRHPDDLIQLDCGHGDESEHEEVEPAHQQMQARGERVVPVFRGEPAAQFVAVGQVVEAGVAQHRAGDLEAGRAEQSDVFAHRPVDGDHDLRHEQAVVAGAAA
ncbi:hypothetical protein [Streptomyces collinus]|uniref:hypothetical protein n=1 Tax=Streptomyces collinus TaxID=42684 RepID=UPI00367EC669